MQQKQKRQSLCDDNNEFKIAGNSGAATAADTRYASVSMALPARLRWVH